LSDLDSLIEEAIALRAEPALQDALTSLQRLMYEEWLIKVSQLSAIVRVPTPAA